MKKIFNSPFAFCLLSLGLTLGACSSDDDNSNNNNTGGTENPVLQDSVGTVARPTDWVAATQANYPSSMSIIIDNTVLPATVDEQDLVAAFINDTCRAVASPEIKDRSRFYLNIICPQGKEHDASLKVILRYYSAQKKYIYTSDAFNFKEDDISSDLDNSFKVNWTLTSK